MTGDNDWLTLLPQWGIPSLITAAVSLAFNSWRNGRAARKAAPDVKIDKTLERAATVQALQDGLFENQRQLLEAATHRAEVAEQRAEAAERRIVEISAQVEQLRAELKTLRQQVEETP